MPNVKAIFNRIFFKILLITLCRNLIIGKQSTSALRKFQTSFSWKKWPQSCKRKKNTKSRHDFIWTLPVWPHTSHWFYSMYIPFIKISCNIKIWNIKISCNIYRNHEELNKVKYIFYLVFFVFTFNTNR